MIGVVATIRVKEGSAADFEAVALKLVEAVNANEPGCSLYRLHKSDEENTYVFMERYDGPDAVEAHRKSDHFRTLGKEMGAFMAGAPEILRLKQVG